MKDTINQIMEIMNQIKYGFLDKFGNNIFDKDNVENIFNDLYYLMSPKELLNKKTGVCWDQVELERTLFEENKIKSETYFIYIDDKKYLPSHTFLIFYMEDKVYWFEHSWYDEMGIHEYNSINDLLNDVEIKFRKSREKEVSSNLDAYIYKYNKPNYNISCDDFYKYILTQKKIINYKLEYATDNDFDRLKKYKLETIMEYAGDLSDEEIKKIHDYIYNSITFMLKQYKNIVYNEKVIGSLLVRNIDNGILLDEIFIEPKFRNTGIGTSIINNIISNTNKNIYLWVYKDNIKAFNLYSKLGFVIKKQTDSRYYMVFVRK